MRLETLEDVIAWTETLGPRGVTAYDNAELCQALRVLARVQQENDGAAKDAKRIAKDAERIAEDARRLTEHLDDTRDEVLRAAYEHGYHTGWAHALEAIDEA